MHDERAKGAKTKRSRMKKDEVRSMALVSFLVFERYTARSRIM
jgi:hypothetical protein